MTQEEKELLLVDLCGRLPYDVKVQVIGVSDYTGEYLSPKIKTLDYLLLGKLGAVIKGYRKDEIKPYLFPMSSMTDEQEDELKKLMAKDWHGMYYHTHDSIDWLNAHHFDYRGLIPMDLAIDATGLNVY